MFPSQRDRFPSDPFELANCVDIHEILRKLDISKGELSDKWFQFFSAALNSSPEKRFSVKDLMQILQIAEPAEHALNASINHLLRCLLVGQCVNCV